MSVAEGSWCTGTRCFSSTQRLTGWRLWTRPPTLKAVITMIQTRTSWNSSSEELGLSVHGATVPPTLPEALTWGNKFPTTSASALFLPLPSTPKGPTLKKAGWGWGPQLISVGSEKRGAILNSLTFLFQFLSFVKVWALGFSRFVLYVKGHDLGFKGIALLPPLLCVLSGARPRASANSAINSTPTSYLVLSLGSAGHAKPPQRRKQSVQ